MIMTIIVSFQNWIQSKFFSLLHAIILPLRYKIELKGAECVNSKSGELKSPILFLANHSSHIDGTILGTELIKLNIPLTIWALDETFKLPYLRWAARHKNKVSVVKVPNINERRSEKHSTNLHKLVTRTGDGLRKGKSFLIFPSGRCKKTPFEKIDGKSAVPLIIHQCPNVKIILMQITGLWGSRFSGATKYEERWATHSIRGWDMFWQTLKMVILNGIFFIPKRKIVIQLVPAEDFPRLGSRLEINRYLEEHFNKAWGSLGEPLQRVPDYFWINISTQHQYDSKSYYFDLNKVSKPMRNSVIKLIADKANLDCKDIDFEMLLGRDLGFDSLEIAELLTSLEREYDIKQLVPEDLTTVGHLIAIAAKIPIACEIKKTIPSDLESPYKLRKPSLFSRLPSFFKSR